MNRSETIENAIKHLELALSTYVKKSDKSDKAGIHKKLAKLYYYRLQGNRLENYELSILHGKEALRFFNKKLYKIQWAELQLIMGLAYSDRVAEEKGENIEKSIYYYKKALMIFTQEEHPLRWAEIQVLLAASYSDRPFFDHVNNIEQAISHYELVLNNIKAEQAPVLWGQAHMNLGTTYRKRKKGGEAENIDKAIINYLRALEVFTFEKSPNFWANCHNNLGNAFRSRINGDKFENLGLAINHLRSALEVRKKELDPEKWAETQINLAIALMSRSEISKENNNDVEQAIGYLENLLESFSKETSPFTWARINLNLGSAYLKLSMKQLDQSNSIDNYFSYSKNSLEVFSPSAFPQECLKIASSIATSYARYDDWLSASKYYELAIQADEHIYSNSLSESSKEFQLRLNIHLYEHASYSYAKNGNFKKALEVIETGRTRLLRDKYDKDTRDVNSCIESNGNPLFSRLERALKKQDKVRNLQSILEEAERNDKNFQTKFEAQENLYKEIQYLLDKIRKLPNFKYFMSSLPALQIQEIAKNTLPIAYIITTNFGGLILIVLSKKILPIWLENLTFDSLTNVIAGNSNKELLSCYTIADMYCEGLIPESVLNQQTNKLSSLGYFGNYLLWRRMIKRERKSKEVERFFNSLWFSTIENVLKWLGKVVMIDLVRVLKDLSIREVLLIPTGLIGLLPLHAANLASVGDESDVYASNVINFIYAPSAYAIQKAQKHLSVPLESIIAIDDPDESLSLSTEEVSIPFIFLKRQNQVYIKGSEASLKKVKEKLPSANIIHISAHGLLSLVDPKESGIKLAYNDYLKLSDIYSMKFNNTRLAVITACEIGLINPQYINEAISISTGLMEAGIPAVISAMWAVDSLSTLLLISKFYEFCISCNDEPREALSKAQMWLRCSTTSEILEFLKPYIPELSGINDKEINISLRQAYWEISRKKGDEIPFSHPYHWAAFYYSGL